MWIVLIKGPCLFSTFHGKRDKWFRFSKMNNGLPVLLPRTRVYTCFQAFSLEQDAAEVRNLNTEEARDVVSTELSRVEFAEALSMKPNSLFVNNLFPLLDKDKDGYVTFREFLDLMVVFSKGTTKQEDTKQLRD